MASDTPGPLRNWRLPPTDTERAIVAIGIYWEALTGRKLSFPTGDLDVQSYLVAKGRTDTWNTISRAGGGHVVPCVDARGDVLLALWQVVNLLHADLRETGKPAPVFEPPAAAMPIPGKGSGGSDSTLPTAKPGEGEGIGGAGSAPTKTRKTKRGRKRLSREESQRRTGILSAWEQARNAGTRMKTFCQEHRPSLSVKELERIVAWKCQRALKTSHSWALENQPS